jgi:hypothetical protein
MTIPLSNINITRPAVEMKTQAQQGPVGGILSKLRDLRTYCAPGSPDKVEVIDHLSNAIQSVDLATAKVKTLWPGSSHLARLSTARNALTASASYLGEDLKKK